MVFFFFKQKTADEMRISDWSSDVCSSDLLPDVHDAGAPQFRRNFPPGCGPAQPLRGSMRNSLFTLAAAVVLAIGVAVAGWFVGDGFLKGRQGDRYVTGKALADRAVKDDPAVWPLRLVATGNEQAAVPQEIVNTTRRVQTSTDTTSL